MHSTTCYRIGHGDSGPDMCLAVTNFDYFFVEFQKLVVLEELYTCVSSAYSWCSISVAVNPWEHQTSVRWDWTKFAKTGNKVADLQLRCIAKANQLFCQSSII